MKGKKRNGIFVTSDPVVVLLLIIIGILVLAPVLLFYSYRIGAHQALREARNVQLSMNLLAIEGQRTGEVLADKDKSSGIRAAMELEIYKLSEAEGEIRVHRWDGKGLQPVEFTYETDNCMVTYYKEESAEKPVWEVRRLVKVLEAK